MDVAPHPRRPRRTCNVTKVRAASSSTAANKGKHTAVETTWLSLNSRRTPNQVRTPVRKIEKTYDDPLSLVWIDAAARMGMQVVRSDEVNASWNGDGILTIGTPETLDPDDCLAQMILHEVCHALCEGPESLHQLDWGLDNFDPTKKVHEHACLRLQAALADQYNMRGFFASTTMFRSYYDRLPAEPLAACDDASITQAKAGWERARNGPWAAALDEALRRTAQIASVLHGLTTKNSLWHGQGTPAS